MYKNYHMTKHTLPMETSVIISTHDMSQYVNDIVKIPGTEFRQHRCNIIASQNDIKNNIICLHKFLPT